jgi:hypothetical protein
MPCGWRNNNSPANMALLRPEHLRTTRKCKKQEGLLNTDEWLIAWFLLAKAHPLVLHCNVNMSI